MFELMRANQINLMLLLCGACAIITILLFMTRFLSDSRKKVMILMELIAFFLLWSDRLAYVYAGDQSNLGFVMVRISNFLVFFLTPAVVLGFNIYLTDWLMHEGGMKEPLVRLRIIQFMAIGGMLLVVISAFTGLYYYFDEANRYHRGQFFLIAYIIPVVCPLIQLTVILQFRKLFSRLIFTSMLIFIFVPIGCGILQVFTYGLSLVNISMVIVSIAMYFFTYLDINNDVEKTHEIEIQNMQGENKRMQKLFDETATAFVAAVEKKDESIKGCSRRVAECAKQIAKLSGMDESECEKVYYAALLHNIGLIGIRDDEIFREGDDPKRAREIAARMPVIGDEILSNIRELPYLAVGARYCHEKYDGTGYPEGLKGEKIPEIARIIAVADAYVLMKTDSTFSRNLPEFIVREELVKGEGVDFDPQYAELMIKIIDEDSEGHTALETEEIEKNIKCREYREQISTGLPIESGITKLTFECGALQGSDDDFFAPSVILFDSYDRRVHDNERAIAVYKYLEYAEIWFDNHSVQTAAAKIQETVEERIFVPVSKDAPQNYEILMGRYEDHLKLVMTGPVYKKEVIVALPGGSKSAFLALTGENCEIRNISQSSTGKVMGQGDIQRIVSRTSYIDRMESDIRNVQIDRTRSASTEGIELYDRLTVRFHTMSLPGAGLVWHCPYVLLFYSEDGKVYGKDYREYALIKLYGESDGNDEFAQNSISMKRTDEFEGWDKWKEKNLRGLECEVMLKRKDNRIVLKTQNLGIELENITTINDDPGKVYVALTGDEVAITDIRVR